MTAKENPEREAQHTDDGLQASTTGCALEALSYHSVSQEEY
jgi:hypothetical protein